MFSLKNKTVIVTGATGHLGRAICISLAEHEADIAVCSTTQANADAFAEKLGDSRDPFASLAGKKLAFLGDTSCNMANSWMLAASLFGLDLVLCGPDSFQFLQGLTE